MRNIDQGGLWNPCELLVTLIETVEIIFREETNVKLTSIPTSDILKCSLNCPEVISHWESIVHDYSFEMNQEGITSCQTAEYGRFRRDLGCGKAENLGAGEQKRSGGGLRAAKGQ